MRRFSSASTNAVAVDASLRRTPFLRGPAPRRAERRPGVLRVDQRRPGVLRVGPASAPGVVAPSGAAPLAAIPAASAPLALVWWSPRQLLWVMLWLRLLLRRLHWQLWLLLLRTPGHHPGFRLRRRRWPHATTVAASAAIAAYLGGRVCLGHRVVDVVVEVDATRRLLLHFLQQLQRRSLHGQLVFVRRS